MIGMRKAGVFVASEIGRTGGERRGGTDRRQAAMSVAVDRRTVGERRVAADRRLVVRTTWEPCPAASAGVAFEPSPPAPAPPLPQEAAIAGHRAYLSERVGRDVGEEVATLDYLLNVSPGSSWPTVIESAALADIERRAMTDGLTGLFNRGFLESVLSREMARCRRHGVMASLLLVDLDEFKETNDRCGHGAGDVALKIVADVIRRQLRAADSPCRYGGDEFAIVLPDTYRSGAFQVGERIVAEVRHQFSAHMVAGCRISLTVSVGVASYGAACGTHGALIDAADRALYQAKATGGDRVAHSP